MGHRVDRLIISAALVVLLRSSALAIPGIQARIVVASAPPVSRRISWRRDCGSLRKRAELSSVSSGSKESINNYPSDTGPGAVIPPRHGCPEAKLAMAVCKACSRTQNLEGTLDRVNDAAELRRQILYDDEL